MASSRRPGRARAAAAVALVVVMAVVALAIDLFVAGPRGVERAAGGRYAPYPAALLPVACAGLLLLGLLWRRQLQLAWAGVLVLALWGGVTVRYEGMPFLAAAVLLVPLLLLVQRFGGEAPAGRAAEPGRSDTRRRLVTVATAVATLLTVAAMAVAGYLLVIGQRWVGSTDGVQYVEHRPYPLAVIPLAAGALLLLGLWVRRRRPLAWAGLLFLVLFGGLTIFSVGLPYLAVAVPLLPLLALIQLLRSAGGGRRAPAAGAAPVASA